MIRIGADVNVWKYKGRKEVYENNKKKNVFLLKLDNHEDM